MPISHSVYKEMLRSVKSGYKKIIDFNKLIEAYQIKTEDGSDNYTIISGKEGSGKSSFALFLARKYHKKIKKEFDYYKNTVFLGDEAGANEYFAKYEKLDKKESFIIDEGEALFPSTEHMKSHVKKIIKHVQADTRKEKQLINFICTPTIRSIHQYIRNSRVDHWFYLLPKRYSKTSKKKHLKNKIIGVMFKKSDSAFEISTSDPWELNKWHEFEKIYFKKNGLSLQTRLEILRGHPLYIGEFKVKKINNKIYDKYLQAREKTINVFGKTPIISKIGNYDYNDILFNAIYNILSKYEYFDKKGEIKHNINKAADELSVNRKHLREFYKKYILDMIHEKQIKEREKIMKK